MFRLNPSVNRDQSSECIVAAKSDGEIGTGGRRLSSTNVDTNLFRSIGAPSNTSHDSNFSVAEVWLGGIIASSSGWPGDATDSTPGEWADGMSGDGARGKIRSLPITAVFLILDACAAGISSVTPRLSYSTYLALERIIIGKVPAVYSRFVEYSCKLSLKTPRSLTAWAIRRRCRSTIVGEREDIDFFSDVNNLDCSNAVA
ncbi:hypothetical protein V1527DRAFT_345946 [Lipomyces starkeyi]